MAQLTASVFSAVDQYEQINHPRQRKRREIDEANHRAAVEAVVANLAHAAVFHTATGSLAITTGKAQGRNRYDNPALGRNLTDLLHAMEGTGILHRNVSTQRGMASDIRPSGRFAARVQEAGLGPDDFGRGGGEETIIVSHKAGLEAGNRRVAIDYRDTATSRAFRAELRALNEHLAGADIQFLDDGLGPVDTRARCLKRYFVVSEHSEEPSFELGGRFFGGFWMNLQSARRAHIRIDGEPPALLDYAAMFPRLAYAHLGKKAPHGDIYAVDGLEGHRTGVKRAFNCFLFDAFKGRSRWPTEMGKDDGERWLPSEWTVTEAKRAILRRHPAMADMFGTGAGLQLMMVESRILAEVMRRLRGGGITPLGIHDGLLVRRSAGVLARKVMESVALDIAGAAIPVAMAIAPPMSRKDTP